MLDITKHKNNHIELHLGPYFRGFISTMSGFFMLVIIIAIIMILAKDLIPNFDSRMLTIIFLISMFPVFLNIFLGFEGIEFDLEKREFRHYVKYIGVKFGVWQDLKPYTMLCLSAQYNRLTGTTPWTDSDASHKRSLEINLASHTKEAVLLAECKNYKVAERALNSLNNYLQLEVKNFVKEDYMKPSPRDYGL